MASPKSEMPSRIAGRFDSIPVSASRATSPNASNAGVSASAICGANSPTMSANFAITGNCVPPICAAALLIAACIRPADPANVSISRAAAPMVFDFSSCLFSRLMVA